MFDISNFNNRILVNYNNVDNLFIQEMYCEYSHQNKWWEIRMYPNDILARFDNVEKCQMVFNEIIYKVCEHNETVIFITLPKKVQLSIES